MPSTRDSLQIERQRLKVKVWKNMVYSNGNKQPKSLYSDTYSRKNRP